MDEKIISVYGKKYNVVKSDGSCQGCIAQCVDSVSFCDKLRGEADGHCDHLIFQEVTEPEVQQEPLARPPIGIIPLVNHNAMRLNVLMDTLQRYAEAGTPIKEQWVQEVKSLIEYERSLTSEALDKVPFKL